MIAARHLRRAASKPGRRTVDRAGDDQPVVGLAQPDAPAARARLLLHERERRRQRRPFTARAVEGEAGRRRLDGGLRRRSGDAEQGEHQGRHHRCASHWSPLQHAKTAIRYFGSTLRQGWIATLSNSPALA
jgi:hypothetical protein